MHVIPIPRYIYHILIRYLILHFTNGRIAAGVNITLDGALVHLELRHCVFRPLLILVVVRIVLIGPERIQVRVEMPVLFRIHNYLELFEVSMKVSCPN